MIPSQHNRRRRCSLQVPILHNYSSNYISNSSGELLKKSVNSPTKSGTCSGCSGSSGETGSLNKKRMFQHNVDPEYVVSNPDQEHLRRSSLQAPMTEMEFLNRNFGSPRGTAGQKILKSPEKKS